VFKDFPFDPRVAPVTFKDAKGNAFWQSHLGPQTWALIEDAKEVLYGGARGGGKTAALIAWLTLGNLKLPPTHPCHYSYLNHPKFRALVLRRDATDLKDFVSEASAFFRHFGLVGGKAKDDPPEFHFPSKAVIYTNHLKNEDAFEKYKGANLQKIGVEELTLIESENSYLKVFGSLRSPYPEIVPQIFCTTNPDGNGAPWVRKRFIYVPGPNGNIPWGTTMRDTFTGLTRVFIPAKLSHNPSLGKDYLAMLKVQDEKTRRAWIDGDWDALSGAYFSAFRPNGPLLSSNPPEPPEANHVIKGVPLMGWWPRYIGCDWGYRDNAAAVWICNNQQDGRYHVYDELVRNRVGAEQLGVLIAQKTLPALAEQPDMQIPLYLSHDAFAVRDVTKTTAELIQRGIDEVLGRGAALLANGEFPDETWDGSFDESARIVIHRAGKDRVGVWQWLRSLLRFEPLIDIGQPDQEYIRTKLLDGPDGMIRYEAYMRSFQKKQEILPGILFWKNCPITIDEVASAVHDEKKPEDILDARTGTSHMDALQALRHVLMFLQKQQNSVPFKQFFAERMNQAQHYADDPTVLYQVARKAQSDFNKQAPATTFKLHRASSRQRVM
jgi:hypothetical protein